MSPKAAEVAREIEEQYRDRPVEALLVLLEWMRKNLPGIGVVEP